MLHRGQRMMFRSGLSSALSKRSDHCVCQLHPPGNSVSTSVLHRDARITKGHYCIQFLFLMWV